MDALIWIRDWIYLLVFLAFVVVIAWQIWRRHDPARAHEVRARGRSRVQRAWDAFMAFWTR